MPRCLRSLNKRRAGLVGILTVLLDVSHQIRRAGPRLHDKAARIARLAPPAAGRADNCSQTTVSRARRRTFQVLFSVRARRPSAPGALDCIRNAISNELIRVAISGSPVTPRRYFIEAAYGIERIALQLRIHTFGIREIEHGIAARAELHALIDRRQKSAAPA